MFEGLEQDANGDENEEDEGSDAESDISDMFGDETQTTEEQVEDVMKQHQSWHSMDVMLRLSGWNNAV